ncbi:DUF2178 domain-containing protein [Methanosarcina sp. KYL-1]|nr:DUF2178 domain-containing protein [Methanosarcina sp. KYL-1]
MGSFTIGIFLVTIGIYIWAYSPTWVSSVSGAAAGLIVAGVALILIALWKYKIRKSGEIKEDERDYRIAEKASFKTFQIIFILQGVLYATLGILNIQLPAQPVVGALFAITGISYAGIFQWYRRKM